MKLISILICFISLTGCLELKDKRTNAVDKDDSGVYKYYDKDNNVMCYGYYTHGISCVQLKKEGK